jgi:acyl transferase domain-containing protein
MLNDDGRCYSFDSRGSGYGRSEGVATVVLKRLDDALRDRDPVRAVIRNSGVNSDGRTNGKCNMNVSHPDLRGGDMADLWPIQLALS